MTMRTLNCSEFLDQHLESWLDGVRPAEAEAHVRGCRSCQSVASDVAAISSFARTMADQDPEPYSRVWVVLRARLEEEGLIVRETAILAAPRGHAVGWAARWFGWVPAAMPRPAVAVAYLALMAVGGFMIGSHTFIKTNDSAWYDSIRGSATPVSVALDTAEQDTISDLHEPNPVVAASFHKNLALVDNYIQLCEKSVREEPQNELARDYLYDAYHQKADLLDQISERGDESR
jgi:hypothetical protein